MSDDKSKRGSRDRARIALSEDYEVRYWATKLGVSEQELKAAVRAVGDSAKAVEEYLRRG